MLPYEPPYIAQPNAIASVPQLAVHASRAEARWNSAWIAFISTTACRPLSRVEFGVPLRFPGMSAAEAHREHCPHVGLRLRPALGSVTSTAPTVL